MSRRHAWEETHNRFDPALPVRDPAWRADRERSPVGRILAQLDSPFGPPRVLLLGTTGTGKSTELLRIAEARADDDLVVHLDLVRHFNEVVGDQAALLRLTSWEVCFLTGLAVIRAAKDAWGHRWDEGEIGALGETWKAVAEAAGTTVPPTLDIGKLVESMVVLASGAASGPAGAGLTVLSAAASALQWVAPLGVGARTLRDQDTEIRDLLDSVNRLLARVRGEYGRRVLIIIDGLDRISTFRDAKALFVDSQLISRLDSPLVVTGPFALRHHQATATIRGLDPYTLVNEPVLDQADPSSQGPGVTFFEDVFGRRTADLPTPALVPVDLVRRLAYYSGGRSRDFVKLVRNVARRAWEADEDVATPAIVEDALDEARLLLESGLHAGHIELLTQVANDPEHRLPADEAVWDLLGYARLLPYPNESEWFYPHLLLTRHLVRLAKAGSTPSA